MVRGKMGECKQQVIFYFYIFHCKPLLMRIFLLTVILLCALGCNSKKPDAIKTEKKDSIAATIVPSIKQDSMNIAVGSMESIGDLSLGLDHTVVIAKLGEPESKSKEEEWGADGLKHQDWIYTNKGLTLNMASWKNPPDQTVFSITVENPSILKTPKNIGIGSSYNEVLKAYDKDIDREMSDKTSVVVGSVYGGVIFNFVNDKVVKIFVGAAAE